MLDWLKAFSAEDFAVTGSALGALIGAGWLGIKGATKGKPTSAALASAVAASNCRVMDLAPVVDAIARNTAEIAKAIERFDAHMEKHDTSVERQTQSLRDLLIRIEDRARR